MIVTLDGPAGSGKSTVAQCLAEKLGVTYLDTGAMYRAITWAALKGQWPLDHPEELARQAQKCRIDFFCHDSHSDSHVKNDAGTHKGIRLDGQDITSLIRSPEVTDASHYIAGNVAIREFLVDQQRLIARQAGSLVTEGRDQGTLVFPNADYKFYLDATAECRAKRRYRQMPKGQVRYEDILNSQIQRDQRDTARLVGALKTADDAIVIDTTEMTLEQVVEKLYKIVTP
ncbi:MAG: (d)CMP kinase [Phycisphaerae bacterium]|nr:(d)CMP kinase [Phycisphaerae bacterium]